MTTQSASLHNLKQHVSTLADKIGERHIKRPKALGLAANYISDQWRAMGYEVKPQTFTTRGVKCANLEVSLPGTKRPDKIILLGAHYDTISGSPGANDNGSGIAALLEISRLIRSYRPQGMIRFVAFTNEEPPFFGTDKMGSWIYAHRAREQGDNIHAAIILETLGYYTNEPYSQLAPALLRPFFPNRGNFIATVSNLRSYGAARRFSRAFRQHSAFPCKQVTAPNFIPGVSWSDHSPFWVNGYKAFMVTDTAPYRYPFYHSAKDTADKLNYMGLNHATNGILNALIAFDRQR